MSPDPVFGQKVFRHTASLLARIHLSAIVLALLTNLWLVAPHSAFGVTISNTTAWRDESGANTVGFLPGDGLFFGAINVAPAGAGTSVTAAQSGLTLPIFFLGGGAGDIAPGQYGRTIPYNSSLTGSWLLTAVNGTDTATATTPAPGAVASMPFANSVTIGGIGTTPTISWAIPAGATPDLVRIGVFDDQQPAAPRKPIIFESGAISTATTNFTIPAGLLEVGHRYVARVELIETYGNVFNGASTFFRSRSNAFFSLVPLRAGSPSIVYLPTVDGSRFAFSFAVAGGATYYIDPAIAIGYQFQTGLGNPNFASVLLPSIGDNLFDLATCGGASLGSATAGIVHSFGAGGVNCFKVLGIEASAALDPNDPTAFITGLTFTGDGEFTGTMDPIVTPEPPTLVLVSATITGIGLARWRRRR